MFDVHDATVPLANTMFSRHVPAALAGVDLVAGSKCPARMYVNFTLLPESTPFWDVLPLNDPFDLIATCNISNWSLMAPEGVQVK